MKRFVLIASLFALLASTSARSEMMLNDSAEVKSVDTLALGRGVALIKIEYCLFGSMFWKTDTVVVERPALPKAALWLRAHGYELRFWTIKQKESK